MFSGSHKTGPQRTPRGFAPNRGRRVHVVGTTGSGKTSLARRLADRRGCPHVELDAIHWGPNWTPLPLEEFRARAAEALSGDDWTVDGNYSRVRDIVWSRADTVVWLDYAIPVILGRLFLRTMRRGITGEELWNRNREHLWVHFFTRDSLFLWALKTFRRRRREYPQLLAQPEHAHLSVIHLRSPKATREWLATVPTVPAPNTDQLR